jgi:Protein of unknown function (DUF4232)
MDPNESLDQGVEARLRAAFQRARVPASPPSLRARIDELAAEPARHRSPRRPAALLAAAAIAIVGLTGASLLVGSRPPAPTPPSPSRGPSSPPSSSPPVIVPWVDRPAAQYVAPTPVPFPTDARPCRASDLKVSSGPSGTALGNFNLRIDFLNVSTSACLLRGEPTLAGVTAAGKAVPLHATSGGYFGDPGPPANIAPGERAAVNVGGAVVCDSTSSRRAYEVLRISLPNGGGPIDLRLAPLETPCGGVSVSEFGVPALAEPTPEPSISPMTARIDAPPTVRAGTTLSYTVTLSNPSGADVSLVPCPSYTEAVGSGSSSRWVGTVRYYELNCDTIHAIPAGGSVTFEMRLALPKTQPTSSDVKFTWYLQGDSGPFAGAPLEIVSGP